jgi:hypothetical protein
MTGRLALLMALGAVSACDAPPRAAAPAPPPAPAEPVAALSRQQIQQRAEQCGKKAREAFRRDSGGGGVAEFASHYNTGRDTCFYVLTIIRQETLSKKLLDIYENETYGEFLGLAAGEPPPKGLPATCRVESLYCASRGEWEILAAPYMRD